MKKVATKVVASRPPNGDHLHRKLLVPIEEHTEKIPIGTGGTCSPSAMPHQLQNSKMPTKQLIKAIVKGETFTMNKNHNTSVLGRHSNPT